MRTLTRYAEERLRILERLREEAAGASLTDLFRPNAAELRFTLGTSLADLRLPYKLAADLETLARGATIEAFLVGAQRHKPSVAPAEYDRLVLIEGFDPTLLRPLTFTPPSTVTREPLRRAFAEMVESHAGIDSGLVASVLGTGRAGRELLLALHSLFSRARHEARSSDTGEPTAYLVALMLRSLAQSTHALTREAPVSEPMSRYLRSAVGVIVGSIARLALRESGLWRDAGLSPSAPKPGETVAPAREPREVRSGLLAAAALGQLPFLGQRPAIAQSGVVLWGVGFESMPPLVEETVTRLANGDDAQVVARELAARFTRDKEVQRRMERAGALGALRERIRELARLMESQRSATLAVPDGGLERLALGRDGLERLLHSESKRQAVARSAREAARLVTSEEARSHLEVLVHAVKEYRDDEPAAWLGAIEARQRAARAVTALAADLLVDRYAAQASQLLLERTGAETESGAEGEYETGRLYLVGSQERPILKARVRAPQVGHLFTDMKDFTRRTAFLKESVIADFLQREFYSPILSAASGQDPGSRGPQGPVGIQLNNLVGDAISFSGDIVELVRLSYEVRTALSDYARRLEAEASQENIAARVHELETQFRGRHEAMERSLKELVSRAPRAEPAMREAMLLRAGSIRDELSRQAALFESERARAAGERLEAGSFVSFGAAPVVVRFEDPVFGAMKVAIAEKINESARGTARSGAVREKVAAALARARRATGRPLELPFAVHVESPMTLPLSAEQAASLADLLGRGDEAGAQALLVGLARRRLQDSGPGELFNAGAAMSEEALRAYLEARTGELVPIERTLSPGELHPALQERFFFPRGSLQLVAAVEATSGELTELFVFQGRALFRGFEATGGLGIWELIDASNSLFLLLAEHHLPAWLERPPNA